MCAQPMTHFLCLFKFWFEGYYFFFTAIYPLYANGASVSPTIKVHSYPVSFQFEKSFQARGTCVILNMRDKYKRKRMKTQRKQTIGSDATSASSTRSLPAKFSTENTVLYWLQLSTIEMRGKQSVVDHGRPRICHSWLPFLRQSSQVPCPVRG